MKTTIRLNAMIATAALLTTATAQGFFDPHVGRFATRDPLGEHDGGNLYVLVRNTPISSVDPFGLQMVGLPGSGLPSWPIPSKPPQYPQGFSLCRRDLQKDSSCDCPTMIGNALGGEHSYLQYVSQPEIGPPYLWGWGFGPGGPGLGTAFQPEQLQAV
jgi:RHS repeat-associated protein